MGSYYEENPEALTESSRRKEFQDELLAGTGLELFIASDPENPGQDLAKRELLLVIERAWQANRIAARLVDDATRLMEALV